MIQYLGTRNSIPIYLWKVSKDFTIDDNILSNFKDIILLVCFQKFSPGDPYLLDFSRYCLNRSVCSIYAVGENSEWFHDLCDELFVDIEIFNKETFTHRYDSIDTRWYKACDFYTALWDASFASILPDNLTNDEAPIVIAAKDGDPNIDNIITIVKNLDFAS